MAEAFVEERHLLKSLRWWDGFVIALPYGTDADWCRNVLAAGKCTLTWHEQEYPLERPELLERAEATKGLPVFTRLLYTAGGINQFLWLHQQKEAPAKVSCGERERRMWKCTSVSKA